MPLDRPPGARQEPFPANAVVCLSQGVLSTTWMEACGSHSNSAFFTFRLRHPERSRWQTPGFSRGRAKRGISRGVHRLLLDCEPCRSSYNSSSSSHERTGIQAPTASNLLGHNSGPGSDGRTGLRPRLCGLSLPRRHQPQCLRFSHSAALLRRSPEERKDDLHV